MQKRIIAQSLSGGLIVFLLVFLAVFLFASKDTQTSFGEQDGVFYSGKSENGVSLMINVYEGSEILEDMLNTLKNFEISATFFVGGVWASKNNELVQKIVQNGNEIANHGFFHKDHSKLSEQQNESEILNNHNLIKSICGVEMGLFAPPSGSFGLTTLNVAKKLNYKVIMWTKDTIDWRDHDKNLIFKRATNVKAGDFVLMHPTKQTASVLGDIIKSILQKNLKIIKVSQNIYAKSI